MFSASSVFVISWGHGGGFVGKVLQGCVSDTNMVDKISSTQGGCSNAGVCSEKSFVTVFGLCVRQRNTCIPTSFHDHKISGVYRDVWLNAGGRSLYMCVKIHIDKRVKTCKNKNVLLEGEMHRLKDVLKLDVGDRLRFELVCGKLDSHEALFLRCVQVCLVVIRFIMFVVFRTYFKCAFCFLVHL